MSARERARVGRTREAGGDCPEAVLHTVGKPNVLCVQVQGGSCNADRLQETDAGGANQTESDSLSETTPVCRCHGADKRGEESSTEDQLIFDSDELCPADQATGDEPSQEDTPGECTLQKIMSKGKEGPGVTHARPAHSIAREAEKCGELLRPQNAERIKHHRTDTGTDGQHDVISSEQQSQWHQRVPHPAVKLWPAVSVFAEKVGDPYPRMQKQSDRCRQPQSSQ